MSSLYLDPTIGNFINVVVVKIVLLEAHAEPRLNVSTNVKFGKDTLRASLLYGEGIENYMNDAPVDVGTEANSSVVILSEFKNDRANNLGLPLPRGRFHFYREIGGQLEFTGDAVSRDMPADENVELVSGRAFDLVGERHQTNFRVNDDQKSVEETFEIKLRNHRKEAAEIRVVEHPSRWREWEITAKSQEFKKIDGRTIEFRVPVKAGEEKILTYTIRYSHLPPPKG